MEQDAGLDVSLKAISICVVDGDGKTTAQGICPADPEGVAGCFRNRNERATAGETDPVLRAIADGFIAAHATLCQAADDVDKAAKRRASIHPVARRLMTIPGVGPVNALSFVALVDDPGRFTRTSDVDAFLGLTPKRRQFGEVDWSARVSKCGDGTMRGLLFEVASCLIPQVKRFSPLKSWAVRLAGRPGFRKAAVATAHKTAVPMLTLWKSETEYNGRRRPPPDLISSPGGGWRSLDGTEVDRSCKNGWGTGPPAHPANDIGDDRPTNTIIRRKSDLGENHDPERTHRSPA